jgi:DNA polymerase-3 subunit alpha
MIETEQDKREGRENPVKRLMDYAGKIEGLLRNASTHAAGVVIGDRPLDELVPLYRDPRSDMPATQFNMKWVEPAGLVKFDFLGLKTLTVIQNAIDLIHGQGRQLHEAAGRHGDLRTGPWRGEPDQRHPARRSGDLRGLCLGQDHRGVPGGKLGHDVDALVQMKPTCIEDIVALVALYRPGPMENIPKYCQVKNGLRSATTCTRRSTTSSTRRRASSSTRNR